MKHLLLALPPIGAVVLALVACGGTTNDLPPHGEVLVAVDTDLPAPLLASRLRVDLYSEDGRWFESRDIGRTDPRDWPASFSVFSDDDTKEKKVLVRLRVYPEGITRDYRGERFETRPTFTDPRSARSIEELCADPPELRLGTRLTLRAGTDTITDVVPTTSCGLPAHSGAIAAKVVISTHGRYRFDVADALPYGSFATLALRSSCPDALSQIACQVEPLLGSSAFTPGHFPRFDVTLDPGTYYLVAAGVTAPSPADLTLEGMPIDTELPNPEPITVTAPPAPEGPRLARKDSPTEVDETPTSEPLPSAAVDRLLLVRLVPGARRSVRVTLAGACAGTMARLGKDPSRPDIATAETCDDRENERVPVVESALEVSMERPTDSVQGTFGRGTPCDAPVRDDVACVPAGAFLFGNRILSSTMSTRATGSPERIAAISRFYIDKHEVSVARFRTAVARGFTIDPRDLGATETPFPTFGATDVASNEFVPPDRWCSWSQVPRGREEYPISCINWRLARAFCRFEGGDLPTEAQWEYAASTAGRPSKVTYAWGDQEPTCDLAVMGRGTGPGDVHFSFCGDPGNGQPRRYGPVPVMASPDTTPLGIVGFNGNVQEWTLDSANPLSSDCWRAASLVDPKCWEEEAPLRFARGGCWISQPLTCANRNEMPVGIAAGKTSVTYPAPNIGIRCAYAEPPR